MPMQLSTARLTGIEALNGRFSLLRLSGKTPPVERPGQFVALSLPGFFLRRPFSVCDWNAWSFSLLVERVGRGTEELCRLRPGARLELLSCLGNGFDPARAGDAPLLIGGGSGVSPLLGLSRRLLEWGVAPQLILGFNTREDMVLLDEFYRLGLAPCVTTADGSFGLRGLVTAAMDRPHSFFYACGPLAMLRAVCETSPMDGQLSLDARMGCGFGACMGCTVATVGGPKRVCRDGPVFDKGELLWED